MKKYLFLFGFFASLMFLGACDDGDDLVPEPLSESKLEIVDITAESITPNFMENPELRKVQIYIPKGYDNNQSESYSVIYLLHGLPFSEQSFTDPELWEPWIGDPMPFVAAPDFPAEGFRLWVDSMIEMGEMDPVIIVMPDAGANEYGFSMYTNSELNGGYEDYIVNDLVNFMDANYKTKDTKDGRALIGTSQGGYAAVKLGMLHADKFCVVASHTGLLYIEGFLSSPDAIFAENPGGEIVPGPGKFFTNAVFAFGAAWSPNLDNPPYMVDLPIDEFGAMRPDIVQKWLNHDPFSMLDGPQNLNKIRSLKGIYLDAGLQDELGMNGMADAFSTKLTAFGIAHTYENFEGTHFGNIFSRLEVSFPFCSAIMD